MSFSFVWKKKRCRKGKVAQVGVSNKSSSMVCHHVRQLEYEGIRNFAQCEFARRCSGGLAMCLPGQLGLDLAMVTLAIHGPFAQK